MTTPHSIARVRTNGVTLAVSAAIAAMLVGCATRRVQVTSEPAGAMVSLNDVEIGRTPCEADITFYGEYDVVLTKQGFEPLRTRGDASVPVYEIPPLDLAGEVVGARTVIRWHYVLSPSLEVSQSKQDFEQGLLDRARTLRDDTGAPPK